GCVIVASLRMRVKLTPARRAVSNCEYVSSGEHRHDRHDSACECDARDLARCISEMMEPSRSRTRTVGPPNDPLAKLQAGSHASSDAARPLPQLKMYSAGAFCNGRDAVAKRWCRSFSSGPAYR